MTFSSAPRHVKDHASPSSTSVSLSNKGFLARGAGECNVQDGYAYTICFVIALPEACKYEQLISSSLEASSGGCVRPLDRPTEGAIDFDFVTWPGNDTAIARVRRA